MKKCIACKIEMDLSKFSKTKNSCLKCVSEYNKKYHLERYNNDAEFRKKRISQSVMWVKKNTEKRAVIARKRNLSYKIKFKDRLSCRGLVNQKVRFGRWPKASSLLCYICKSPAKHYHHYNGYDFKHRYDVKPICLKCHNVEHVKH